MKHGRGRRCQANGLELAFELHELALEIMRRNLRRRYPRASATEIERRLAEWLLRRPGAANGDGVGVAGSWPRARGETR